MWYSSKNLLFHCDIACYFREHLFCSTWHDLSLWRTIDFSSWYGILFQRIFVVFLSACLLFQETFSHVLIIRAKDMHNFSTLFW
jgi:hypothetical protein